MLPVTGALDTLARLRPVRFHYNADFLSKRPGTPDTEHFGVVAQEFQKVFPDYVDAARTACSACGWIPSPSSPPPPCRN